MHHRPHLFATRANGTRPQGHRTVRAAQRLCLNCPLREPCAAYTPATTTNTASGAAPPNTTAATSAAHHPRNRDPAEPAATQQKRSSASRSGTDGALPVPGRRCAAWIGCLKRWAVRRRVRDRGWGPASDARKQDPGCPRSCSLRSGGLLRPLSLRGEGPGFMGGVPRSRLRELVAAGRRRPAGPPVWGRDRRPHRSKGPRSGWCRDEQAIPEHLVWGILALQGGSAARDSGHDILPIGGHLGPH